MASSSAFMDYRVDANYTFKINVFKQRILNTFKEKSCVNSSAGGMQMWQIGRG